MKLIIEIPDEAVKTDNIANDFITYFECCTPKLFETLKNGTPLPEYHGDLIERRCGNKVCNGCEHSDICDTYNAPTIIKGSDSE